MSNNNNLEIITKTVDYIESHLEEDLNLDCLASEAGYSKYHLHKIFTCVVGFPIHFYIQRRRLTEAARMLVFTNQAIMDIALTAGYETQQSFSVAFKSMFDCSPQTFRKKRDFYPLQLKFTVDGKKELRGDMMMDVKTIEYGEILLAGYKANTQNGFSVIGECWEKLHHDKDKIKNRTDKNYLVGLNDYSVNFSCEDEQPGFDYYAAAEVSAVSEVSAASDLSEVTASSDLSDASVVSDLPEELAASDLKEVSVALDLPEGMVIRKLSAAKYAVFSFSGEKQDSLQPIVEYVYKEWFPQSTCRLDENAMYDFARYGEVFDDKGNNKVEFWVPIL